MLCPKHEQVQVCLHQLELLTAGIFEKMESSERVTQLHYWENWVFHSQIPPIEDQLTVIDKSVELEVSISILRFDLVH